MARLHFLSHWCLTVADVFMVLSLHQKESAALGEQTLLSQAALSHTWHMTPPVMEILCALVIEEHGQGVLLERRSS